MADLQQIEQRSEEWYKMREGRFTASDCIDLCADGSRKMDEFELSVYKKENPKGKKTTTWDIPEGLKTKALEKAIEYFIGLEEQPEYLPKDMQRGVDLEPLAFEKFKELKEVEFLTVENCGFFEDGEDSGSSPDGLVSDNAVLEIKCPNRKTFFDLVRTNEINKKYLYQMQKQMHDTGSEKCYFFNYYIHEGLELYHEIIVLRDEEIINLIQKRIKIAIELRNQYISEIKNNRQWK